MKWNKLIYLSNDIYAYQISSIFVYMMKKTSLIRHAGLLNKFAKRWSNIQGQMVSPLSHDDVIKWKHFPRYWPSVRGIHRSPVNSPHIGQWRGALIFALIFARINDWTNNPEAGDLRRHRTRYDVTVMSNTSRTTNHKGWNTPTDGPTWECKFDTVASSMVTQPSSCGQHGAHLGPVGPRWAPRWPHVPCYQGTH